jgi:prevent-host-death family protein
MKHFGAFHAKTHFSELLRAVMNGEKFIITKNGAEVAMFVPVQQKKEREIETVDDAIRTLKKLRKGIFLGKELLIKEMKEQGRR